MRLSIYMNIHICKICNNLLTHKHLSKHNLTTKEYYDRYILKSDNIKCKCGNFLAFQDLNRGYRQFCSRTCAMSYKIRHPHTTETKTKIKEAHTGRTKLNYEYLKQCSIRMSGQNNPGSKLNRYINHDKWKSVDNLVSKKLKERIEQGTFTPCITNSWANSRVKLDIGNGKLYRSSWDAAFQILNPTCEYEKIRIPYLSPKDNTKHIYIVDFVDETRKIIYEIKPLSNKNTDINSTKSQFASKWAIDNKYAYVIIDDIWFKSNANRIDYMKYNKKIYSGMKQFL